MMRTRQVCQPIFRIEKKPVAPKVQKIEDEPVDIVMIDDKTDDPVEDIQINFAGNEDKFKKAEDFWKFIDGINWRDRSQLPGSGSPMYKHNKCDISNLSVASTQSIKKFFWKYFNELKKVFEEGNIFDSLERELTDREKNELISHIIAKGQLYYATIMKEPYFSGALVAKSSTEDDFESFLHILK